MSGSSYSQDQIEAKRLLALQRKAENGSKNINARQSKTPSKEFSRNGSNQPYFGSPGRKLASPMPGASNPKSADFAQFKYNKDNTGAMHTTKNNHRFNPIKPTNFFGASKIIQGTCSMISETRFVVNVEYHQPLIEIFKKIPSKLYDQQTRRWSFSIEDYNKLITECMHLKPDVFIASIPRHVLQVFQTNLNKKVEAESTDLSLIDSKLVETLMPFQREGISFGIEKKGRCFIADDMGLGKTIQALGIAHYYRERWPLLIVTPSSVRYQWSEAIFNFLPSVPTQTVQHFTSSKDFVGDAKVTIVSYDLLCRSVDLFERRHYGFVILDESHCVKSIKAARTKAVQRITSQAQHVVLLSGTPALSRPVELYSQINLIVPTFMSFHDYGLRYCAAEKKSFGWDYSGSANMQELQLLLKACCLIRRLKTDVLKQLPSKIRQVVILDPALIKKASKNVKEIAAKLNSSSLKSNERHNAILQYYHESSDQKILAVCNYVSDLVDRGQKFLVYAHHQNVLDAIMETLQSKEIQFIRIDGKTLPEHRKQQVDRFQDSDTCLVAVLSITAANAGITLTAAQLVVFAELFWNPGILCQAEDRVHRIGQGRGVVIQYLVAKNTADDHLWPLIQNKINVLTKAGLDQDFCLNKADVSDQKVTEELSKTPTQEQSTLDTFVKKTPSPAKLDNPTPLSSIENNLAQHPENYDHLLELDDLDFEEINLDNIA